jgi:hypothetical protein
LCGERPVVYNVFKGQSVYLCRFKHFKAAQNPEDGDVILQSIGNYSTKDTALHPRRFASFK